MRTVSGDIIQLAKDGAFDVIAHGCNCFHAMGGGLAAQIREHFPAAYNADLATPYGDRAKLGESSIAQVATPAGRCVVVNAYTQFLPSRGGSIDVDYDAVRRVMASLKANYAGARIGLPQIGAGLAGGDWVQIEAIIAEELSGEDVSIVIYSGAT